MSESDIIRCDYCGDLMLRQHKSCRACSKINRQTTKGISHAETNLREEIMVGVTQRSERV
jgi:phage FluMu protein Com